MEILESEETTFFRQQFLDVISLAVNVIKILESEETFYRRQFLDVLALAVNVGDFRK